MKSAIWKIAKFDFMEFYIDLLRFASIAIMLLTIVTFFKSRGRNQNVNMGIAFLFSVICYLLIDWGRLNHIFFYFFFVGAVTVPILFWYFTRSLFNDNFEFGKRHWVLFLLIFSIHLTLYFVNENRWLGEQLMGSIAQKLAEIISLVFIILSIAEAYRGKSSDLIEARIKARSIMIYLIGFIITMTLIVEIALDLEPFSEALSLGQKAFIFMLSFGFASQMFALKDGFFAPKRKDDSQVSNYDPEVLKQLKILISDDRVYLQEGLTIRLLAERMEVQEYKLRRVINYKLGFRNFNDFLNSHRIQDACEMILDQQHPDKTILEIAYEVGYASLGPFNKAFKQHTNSTPTQYKKDAGTL